VNEQPIRSINGKTNPAKLDDCQPMLFEDPGVSESLRQVVAGFTRDSVMQEDMMQECIVHLWRLEGDKPAQTRSWYLQSCKFHLQHWLALGRSLDAPKRANGNLRISIDGTVDDGHLDEYHTDGQLFALVSARDLISTLAGHLKQRERAVLGGLAEGLVLREIASKHGLSYPTALKCRRRIASLVVKLSIAAPTLPRPQKAPFAPPGLYPCGANCGAGQ
jgi:DNA-directed RNA polymerase specialized sigma24 family protein